MDGTFSQTERRACDKRFRTESSNKEGSNWGSVCLIPKTCFEGMWALGGHPPTSSLTSFPVVFLIPPSHLLQRPKAACMPLLHCTQHTLAQVKATPFGVLASVGELWGHLVHICVSFESQGRAQCLTHGKWNPDLSHIRALWG